MDKRAVEIDSGKAMVVTDLHGAGDVYRRLRHRFLSQLEAEEVDCFIILGDLIHSEGPAETDESLFMLMDVMRLQSRLGRDRVILLLGNHEMPHIYSTTLAKGDVEYTPRFEQALTAAEEAGDAPYSRAEVMAFLMSLPLYVFTRAGVTLTHAGAAAAVCDVSKMRRVLHIDHAQILEGVDKLLVSYGIDDVRKLYQRQTGVPYDEAVKQMLAVRGPDDPRYNDLLRSMFLSSGDPAYNLLWEALFARNELGNGIRYYRRVLDDFLDTVSDLASFDQFCLVAGHISVEGGYKIVDDQHLRLATHAHANPPEAGCYLLLDCATQIERAQDLVPHLHQVPQ